MAGIKVIPTWVWLVAIILAAGAGWAFGFSAGVNSEKADQLTALEKAVEDTNRRNTESSAIGAASRAAGNTTQVTTEAATHDTQERIRTVYLQGPPVAADCRQPDGVLREINAAGERANSAVRAAAGAPDPGIPHRR